MKLKYILILSVWFTLKANAQDTSLLSPQKAADTPVINGTVDKTPDTKMYHINKAVDYPIILGLGGTSIYLVTSVIYKKKPTPESEILNLNKNSLPAFDGGAISHHDYNLDRTSYIPFYAVMPLPALLLFDSKIAKDKLEIGSLYLEAFVFEGILYTGSVYFIDRFRPDAYNSSLSLSQRESGDNRNSFFAGHVAVVANSTFFISKVYSDYHPHSSLRWWLYGGSAAATIGMGYLRYAAGKHFPSDIVTGAVVGTLCGILVPTFHKKRDFEKQKWSLFPDLLYNGSQGFTFTYKL